MPAAPHRNVELKGYDPDPAATLAAALAHGAADAGVLEQRDTYFAARTGRLKLREGHGGAQLIAYARADEAAARESGYHLVDVPDPAALAASLDAAFGTTVVVRKQRRLLLHDGVRIHLDEVEGLGSFLELEAVVEGDAIDDAHAKVTRLREVLGFSDERVVAEGYAQLLQAGRMVDLARDVRARAYVPYSRFPVGAVLRDETGTLHAAANVENAAFPQGQCAEASAIGVMVAAGGHRITEVAVMADAELITPCGGCRQRLSEFGEAGTPVHLCGPEGIRRTITLGELLPLSFAKEDLPA